MVKISLIRKVLLAFLIVISFAACESSTDKDGEEQAPENEQLGVKLAGQAYFFAPDLDTNTCEVSGECDCCSSNTLFINDSEFVTITYCMADEVISSGTYKVDKDKIFLDYGTLVVNKDYNMAMEFDTTGTVDTTFFIRTKNVTADKETLGIFYCGDKICLQGVPAKNLYGVIDHKTSLENHLKRLKKEGIWDKLKQ